jgi:G:T-mismatch repair DNA endonuclease (very short patch repair protein)
LSRIDELYPQVRDYLRDNPKVGFNVETLSKKLDADIRYIQALADMGYLDRDVEKQAVRETAAREKLAKEFEESLKQMKETSARREGAKSLVSYGQQRHGESEKKKN